MTYYEKLNIILTGVTALAAALIGFFQLRINRRSLEVSDFTEVFLMPQSLVRKKQDGSEEIVGWNLLVKNISAYPIYLNRYIVDGVEVNVGSCSIPHDSDDWYFIPIPKRIQENKKFEVSVFFENYKGKKYRTDGEGSFDGTNWLIKSSKKNILKHMNKKDHRELKMNFGLTIIAAILGLFISLVGTAIYDWYINGYHIKKIIILLGFGGGSVLFSHALAYTIETINDPDEGFWKFGWGYIKTFFN